MRGRIRLSAGCRLFAKRRNPDIADIFAFHPGPDGADFDNRPGHRNIKRITALAADREFQIAADFAAHLFDGLLQRFADDRFAIEMRDQISSLDAGLGATFLPARM